MGANKFLGRLFVIATSPIIFISLFLDILKRTIPALRPHPSWSFDQAFRVRLIRTLLYTWSIWQAGDKLHLRPARERNRFLAVKAAPSKLFKAPLIDERNEIVPLPIGVTWTPSRPTHPHVVKKDTIVALHFHGGAFAIGDGRDEDAGWLCRTLVKRLGVTSVCSVQYRLASSKGGRFPAPYQDAVSAYVYLLQDCGVPADQIIFSGDSAGATICMALLRYIHENGEELGLPPPRALALWSPWTDVNLALTQDMRESPQYYTDYLAKEFALWGANNICDWGNFDPTSPWLSPNTHPFKMKGMENIPLFVNFGGGEILCDAIKEFEENYRKIGWTTHLEESVGCPHDIILLGPRMGFHKEAEAAVDAAKSFFLATTDLPLRKEILREILT